MLPIPPVICGNQLETEKKKRCAPCFTLPLLPSWVSLPYWLSLERSGDRFPTANSPVLFQGPVCMSWVPHGARFRTGKGVSNCEYLQVPTYPAGDLHRLPVRQAGCPGPRRGNGGCRIRTRRTSLDGGRSGGGWIADGSHCPGNARPGGCPAGERDTPIRRNRDQPDPAPACPLLQRLPPEHCRRQRSHQPRQPSRPRSRPGAGARQGQAASLQRPGARQRHLRPGYRRGWTSMPFPRLGSSASRFCATGPRPSTTPNAQSSGAPCSTARNGTASRPPGPGASSTCRSLQPEPCRQSGGRNLLRLSKIQTEKQGSRQDLRGQDPHRPGGCLRGFPGVRLSVGANALLNTFPESTGKRPTSVSEAFCTAGGSPSSTPMAGSHYGRLSL